MTVDIGEVFSSAFAMMKQRWLALLGLWAAFLGILVIYYIGIFVAAGAWLYTATNAFTGTGGFQDAAAYGGLGIGFILVSVILAIGFYVILFAQHGSMVARATPTQSLSFGEAFGRGFKGGLTFIGVLVIYLVASIILWLALALVGLILNFLGDIGGIILGIIVLLGSVYLSCRFSVIIPVIVVEKAYNPIKAINRSWEITEGNVLRIFAVLVITGILALIVLGIPYAVMFAIIDNAGVGLRMGVLSVIFVFATFALVYFIASMLGSAMMASLHAQMSDTQAEEYSKAFE